MQSTTPFSFSTNKERILKIAQGCRASQWGWAQCNIAHTSESPVTSIRVFNLSVYTPPPKASISPLEAFPKFLASGHLQLGVPHAPRTQCRWNEVHLSPVFLPSANSVLNSRLSVNHFPGQHHEMASPTPTFSLTSQIQFYLPVLLIWTSLLLSLPIHGSFFFFK